MIDRRAIVTHSAAGTPEQAIIAAGEALRETGACDSGYVQAMVDNFRRFGPYFVIAPGLAMPHARPEQGAIEAQISLVRLTTPLAFGHDENDPVSVLIGLSATSSDSHIALIQRIVTVLADTQKRDLLLTSRDREILFQLFQSP
ncbi:PTS sugar transporter subunit IIA [Dryocola sp. BD613]|uniref:PTS sugar transporter subunit IIA n=1 Tax=Dryocola sp. BD613 TaxID=3133272 RepID=UPI003F506B06